MATRDAERSRWLAPSEHPVRESAGRRPMPPPDTAAPLVFDARGSRWMGTVIRPPATGKNAMAGLGAELGHALGPGDLAALRETGGVQGTCLDGLERLERYGPSFRRKGDHDRHRGQAVPAIRMP